MVTFTVVKVLPGSIKMGIGEEHIVDEVLLSSSPLLNTIVMSFRKAKGKECSTCNCLSKVILVLLNMSLMFNKRKKHTLVHGVSHKHALWCDDL
jgi:hypothetical protein